MIYYINQIYGHSISPQKENDKHKKEESINKTFNFINIHDLNALYENHIKDLNGTSNLLSKIDLQNKTVILKNIKKFWNLKMNNPKELWEPQEIDLNNFNNLNNLNIIKYVGNDSNIKLLKDFLRKLSNEYIKLSNIFNSLEAIFSSNKQIVESDFHEIYQTLKAQSLDHQILLLNLYNEIAAYLLPTKGNQIKLEEIANVIIGKKVFIGKEDYCVNFVKMIVQNKNTDKDILTLTELESQIDANNKEEDQIIKMLEDLIYILRVKIDKEMKNLKASNISNIYKIRANLFVTFLNEKLINFIKNYISLHIKFKAILKELKELQVVKEISNQPNLKFVFEIINLSDESPIISKQINKFVNFIEGKSPHKMKKDKNKNKNKNKDKRFNYEEEEEVDEKEEKKWEIVDILNSKEIKPSRDENLNLIYNNNYNNNNNNNQEIEDAIMALNYPNEEKNKNKPIIKRIENQKIENVENAENFGNIVVNINKNNNIFLDNNNNQNNKNNILEKEVTKGNYLSSDQVNISKENIITYDTQEKFKPENNLDKHKDKNKEEDKDEDGNIKIKKIMVNEILENFKSYDEIKNNEKQFEAEKRKSHQIFLVNKEEIQKEFEKYKEKQNFKNILRKYQNEGNEYEIIRKYAPTLSEGNVPETSEKLEELLARLTSNKIDKYDISKATYDSILELLKQKQVSNIKYYE